MKKKILFYSILLCCATVFALATNGVTAVKKHATASAKLKKPGNITVYLSGGSAGSSYRIVFAGSNFNGEFPMSTSPISVPAGTYTVGIVPATSGSTHSFSGVSCAVNYSASGTMAQFNNVSLNCGTASFSIN